MQVYTVIMNIYKNLRMNLRFLYISIVILRFVLYEKNPLQVQV